MKEQNLLIHCITLGFMNFCIYAKIKKYLYKARRIYTNKRIRKKMPMKKMNNNKEPKIERCRYSHLEYSKTGKVKSPPPPAAASIIPATKKVKTRRINPEKLNVNKPLSMFYNRIFKIKKSHIPQKENVASLPCSIELKIQSLVNGFYKKTYSIIFINQLNDLSFATFSKRVTEGKKISSTSPIGPLRCFATISFASST